MEQSIRSDERRHDCTVKQIQRFLTQIGTKDTDITKPAIDGIYGDETEDAVRRFQKKYLQKENGKVDINTWQALLAAARDSVAQTAPPCPIYPFHPETLKDGRLRIGDTCDLTMIIKIMLHTISTDFCDFDDLQVNQTFDKETEDAIRCFQQITGLPITGEVDRLTWNALARLYGSACADDNGR